MTTLTSFLTPYMSSAANIALPTIGYEFRLDTAMLGWIQASFLLSTAVFLVPFGRIADIYGRKRVFTAGLVVYTFSSLLATLSPSVEALVLFRIAQGAGGAMIFSTAVAILTCTFPPGQRGKVLGINVAAVYSGISLGPFLGGVLTQLFGWRSIFLVNVPIGLAVLALTLLRLKCEWSEARGSKFDLIGSVVYGGSITLIMSSAFIPSAPLALVPVPVPQNLLAALIGVALLAAFAAWELRIPSPVLNIRLFKENPVFTSSNLAALINYSATYALTFLLSLYLQLAKGLSPQIAGTILVAQPVIQALFSPLAGWLSDRARPRFVASAGMGLNAVSLLLFAFLEEGTDTWLIVANLMVMGLGFALFSAPNTNAVMSSVSRDLLGVASATLATMRSLGMIVSTALAVFILSLFVGTMDVSEIAELGVPLINGLHTSFYAFAALCVVGVLLSLSRSGKELGGRGAVAEGKI